MRSRLKLLFLSRCPGFLSHRLTAGRAGQWEISFLRLCAGYSHGFRHPVRATGLRLDVPLWSGTGTASQTAVSPQKKTSSRPSFPCLSQIPGTGCFRNCPSALRKRPLRHRSTLVLYTPLSLRHTVRRHSPAVEKSSNACFHWWLVRLKTRTADRISVALSPHLPAVL